MAKYESAKIGDVFGMLTVQHKLRSPNRKIYSCECTCGKKCAAVLSDLRSGKTLHCGCAAPMRKPKRNLQAEVYNRLQFVRELEPKLRIQDVRGTEYLQKVRRVEVACQCCAMTKEVFLGGWRSGQYHCSGCDGGHATHIRIEARARRSAMA